MAKLTLSRAALGFLPSQTNALDPSTLHIQVEDFIRSAEHLISIFASMKNAYHILRSTPPVAWSSVSGLMQDEFNGAFAEHESDKSDTQRSRRTKARVAKLFEGLSAAQAQAREDMREGDHAGAANWIRTGQSAIKNLIKIMKALRLYMEKLSATCDSAPLLLSEWDILVGVQSMGAGEDVDGDGSDDDNMLVIVAKAERKIRDLQKAE